MLNGRPAPFSVTNRCVPTSPRPRERRRLTLHKGFESAPELDRLHLGRLSRYATAFVATLLFVASWFIGFWQQAGCLQCLLYLGDGLISGPHLFCQVLDDRTARDTPVASEASDTSGALGWAITSQGWWWWCGVFEPVLVIPFTTGSRRGALTVVPRALISWCDEKSRL
ncbi:hypothetical protein LXL04_001146 [Taraxacum kok-saghyz]